MLMLSNSGKELIHGTHPIICSMSMVCGQIVLSSQFIRINIHCFLSLLLLFVTNKMFLCIAFCLVTFCCSLPSPVLVCTCLNCPSHLDLYMS